jgi:hypothetical protein
VLGGKANASRLFFCANPDSSCSPNKGKRIAADEFRGTFETQYDGIVCIGPNRSEFVRDSQYDARGISAIGNMLGIIRMNGKPLIDSAARECPGNDLAALQVAIHSQIPPSLMRLGEVDTERRIGQMPKLFAVWIDFGK